MNIFLNITKKRFVKLIKSNDLKDKKNAEKIFYDNKLYEDNEMADLYLTYSSEFDYFSYNEISVLKEKIGLIPLDIALNNNRIVEQLKNMLNECINKCINYDYNYYNVDMYNLLSSDIIFKIYQIKGEEIISADLLQNLLNKLFLNSLEELSNHPDTLSQFTNNLKILKQYGFNPTISDEMIPSLFLSPDYQKELYDLGLLNQDIINKMYEYKFNNYKSFIETGNRFLNEYNINPILEPTTDFAIYWRNMSLKLGFDTMYEYMRYVATLNPKNNNPGISEYDFFGERSAKEYYERWKEDYWDKNPEYNERYFNSKPAKLFFSRVDLYKGTLISKDGKLTSVNFSDEHLNSNGLSLVKKLMFINYEGRNNDMSSSNFEEIYSKLFSIACYHMNLISDYYRPIFEQYKKIDNLKIEHSKKMQLLRDYVLLVTGGHFAIVSEGYYDENGISEKLIEHIKNRLPYYADKFEMLSYLYDDFEEKIGKKGFTYVKLFKKYEYLFYQLSDNLEKNYVYENYISDTGFKFEFIEFLFEKKLYANIEELSEDIDDYKLNDVQKKKIELHKKYVDLSYDYDIYINEEGFIHSLIDYLLYTNPLLLDMYKEDIKDYKLTEFDLKYVEEYLKIRTETMRNLYMNYVKEHKNDLSLDKLSYIPFILNRISLSNSTEIRTFQNTIALEILNCDDPEIVFDKIEQIFIKNNLPVVGKIFNVFQILHPNASGFNYDGSSTISPLLKSIPENRRNLVIFSDIFKCAAGSNNKSLIEYIKYIEEGNKIYLELLNQQRTFEQLSAEDLSILEVYVSYLRTLYSETKVGKNSNISITGDLKNDLNIMYTLFNTNDLPDRIVKMFGHFAGFDTLESLKQYIFNKAQSATERNSNIKEFKLEKGDLVKGINHKYLHNILQNGSLAREFLGESAGSDSTPLDTDLSLILENGLSIEDALKQTEADFYGTLLIVLKKSDKIRISRRSPAEDNQEVDNSRDISKLEAFYTGAIGKTHYGIRTGFSSSDIDYFIAKEYNDKFGLEIACNGFYIPIVNLNGELVFSYDDYLALRKKMQGLSFYGEDTYKLSDNLFVPGIDDINASLENNSKEVEFKRNIIIDTIEKALGIKIKKVLDGDLSDNSIELFDTGSTGRGTNIPGDGDFDFIMRLDRLYFERPELLAELKSKLLNAFGVSGDGYSDFRLEDVYLPGIDTPLKIDISFIVKTNKVEYATEMCVQDRLKNIKNQYPDKYNSVLSNIIFAKNFLHRINAYKPSRRDSFQGGMGGVGVENWILQNGGSFIDAVKEFVIMAEKYPNFKDFREHYHVYDFGENHFAEKNNINPHDDFINNMNETGFIKMATTFRILLEFIKNNSYSSIDELFEYFDNNLSNSNDSQLDVNNSISR